MDSILSIERNSSTMMQPTAIIAQIKELFGTEIKWKRVLKQLADLNLLQQNPSFQITPIGLRIPIFFQHTDTTYRFQIRIDNNYPFTKPQIHSLDNNWRYSQARDLLDYGFEEQQQWDSGMSFGDVQLLVPKIVEHIRKTENQLGKEQLVAKGIELFNVTETKKKMLITHNNPKVIGFGKQAFLKFDISSPHLTLQLLLPRSQILQVQQNPSINQLKIIYLKHNTQKQQHFRIQCEQQDYKNILKNLNPINFIEKKVEEWGEDEEEGRSQEMMTNLTTLIGFYAEKDKEKSGKYLKKLRDVVIREEDIKVEEIGEESEEK